MLLSVDHVSKCFGSQDGKVVLDDVSLTVGRGECVGLVGPSGCGKSTLARIAARLEVPDAGSVTFEGVRVEASGRLGYRERREAAETWLDMQMVFQNPEASFSPFMDIGVAVAEGLAYRSRLSRAEVSQRVRDALASVGLPESYAAKRPFELSGGECQRAAIARAIIGAPRLLICDEPTSSLDATIQFNVMGLLRDLHRERGIAFLFISHNLPLVADFCQRIYRMEPARIASEVRPVECAGIDSPVL